MSATDEQNLEALARALSTGADVLRDKMLRFEGHEDGAGNYVPGVKALYEEAVAAEADEILSHYEREEKRPPAEETRWRRAERTIAKDRPELYGEFHALAGSIAAGQRWLSNKRAAVSALQTLNKTNRDLAGMS